MWATLVGGQCCHYCATLTDRLSFICPLEHKNIALFVPKAKCTVTILFAPGFIFPLLWEILSFIATIILPYKLLFLPSRIPLVHPCNPLLRQIILLTLVRWFLLNLFQPFTSSSWSANNGRTNWGGGGGRNFCRKGFLRNMIALLLRKFSSLTKHTNY